MLNYFLTQNWAVELFCCFSKLNIHDKGSFSGLGELADTWVFPPVVTPQYHFDGMGAFKPYVGAGVQYIHYFVRAPSTSSSMRRVSISTIPSASRCRLVPTWRWATAGSSRPTRRRTG